MIQDGLYVFISSSSEDLATSAAVEKLSDAITLEAANISDGGGELFLNVSVKVNTDSALGEGYTIALKHCDTATGTYIDAFTREVKIQDIKTGANVLKVALPIGLKKYLKLSLVGNPSYYVAGNAIDLVAATHTTADLTAAAIRARAAAFLPTWVVTGATDKVIFTAAAYGEYTGDFKAMVAATGMDGTWVRTTVGSATVKEVRTFQVTVAPTGDGQVFFVLAGTKWNTGTIPITIAADTAAKVAAEIRAQAAKFLPNWVVTGATDAVIFTAAANGANTASFSLNPMATGIAGAFVQTQDGGVAAKEIQTLTITAACAVAGDIRLTIGDVVFGGAIAMTGGSTFNGSIVTG